MGGATWEIITAVDLTIGGIFLFNGIFMPMLIAYCFAVHIKMTASNGPDLADV
jgi:hypothetical protein